MQEQVEINALPVEVLAIVFGFLVKKDSIDQTDYANAALVCRHWRDAAAEIRDFVQENTIEINQAWFHEQLAKHWFKIKIQVSPIMQFGIIAPTYATNYSINDFLENLSSLGELINLFTSRKGQACLSLDKKKSMTAYICEDILATLYSIIAAEPKLNFLFTRAGVEIMCDPNPRARTYANSPLAEVDFQRGTYPSSIPPRDVRMFKRVLDQINENLKKLENYQQSSNFQTYRPFPDEDKLEVFSNAVVTVNEYFQRIISALEAASNPEVEAETRVRKRDRCAIC